MKIQRKMFGVFFLVFSVSILIVTWLIYTAANQIIIKNYEKKSEENIEYMLQVADSEFKQMNSMLNAISNNPIVQSRIQEDYAQLSDLQKIELTENVDAIINILSSFNAFSKIDLLYLQGVTGEEYWYGDDEKLYDKNVIRTVVEDVEYHDTGLTYQGVSEKKNRVYLIFTRKIYSPYGVELGRLYFELDSKFIENVFPLDTLHSDTTLYLVDENENVLFASDDNYEVFEAIDELQTTVLGADLDAYNWGIYAVTPEEAIIEDSSRIYLISIVIVSLSILIAGLCLMGVLQRILKPIKYLSQGIQKVKNGDLEVHVNCKSKDELGDLAETFNQMTTALKKSQERELLQLQTLNNLEYEALQAQINPHFLCNTLNSLRWMAEIQEADNIVSLVDLLWTLLRKTASIKGQKVTLEEEIEIADAFTEIQRIRYNDKFQMEYKIAKEHQAVIVPKFILQPIIENAIFHGIEPKRGRGTICITTTRVRNDLEIKIEDDGVGMTKEQIATMLAVEEKTHGLNGIGMGNVNQRLCMLYGESYGLEVISQVEVGTSIIVKIPM